MSHLKKGASGHLLKTSGGHLVSECIACTDSFTDDFTRSDEDPLAAPWGNRNDNVRLYANAAVLSDSDAGDISVHSSNLCTDDHKVWATFSENLTGTSPFAYLRLLARCNDPDGAGYGSTLTCYVGNASTLGGTNSRRIFRRSPGFASIGQDNSGGMDGTWYLSVIGTNTTAVTFWHSTQVGSELSVADAAGDDVETGKYTGFGLENNSNTGGSTTMDNFNAEDTS